MLFLQILLPLLLFLLALLELKGTAVQLGPVLGFLRRYALALLAIVLICNIGIAVIQWQENQTAQSQAKAEIQGLQEQLTRVHEQTEIVHRISSAQLRVAQYLASLDEPILSMQLRLVLDGPRSFAHLCPFLFAYEFYDLSKLSFQKPEGDFHLLRYVAVPAQQQRASYRIYRTLDDTLDGQFVFIDGRSEISEIEVPFYDERPRLAVVRDLHYSLIRVYLTENLVRVVKRIQLVANGIPLHDKPVVPSEWVSTEQKWLRETEVPVWLPASDARQQVRDVINVYASIPGATRVFPLDVLARGTMMASRKDTDLVTGKPLR